jgi:hypothetical protein
MFIDYALSFTALSACLLHYLFVLLHCSSHRWQWQSACIWMSILSCACKASSSTFPAPFLNQPAQQAATAPHQAATAAAAKARHLQRMVLAPAEAAVATPATAALATLGE